jgi:hypothetical protein
MALRVPQLFVFLLTGMPESHHQKTKSPGSPRQSKGKFVNLFHAFFFRTFHVTPLFRAGNHRHWLRTHVRYRSTL